MHGANQRLCHEFETHTDQISFFIGLLSVLRVNIKIRGRVGIVICKCCILVLYEPAIQRTRNEKCNIEGGGGARNGKDVVSVFETLWKNFF